jgi:hypothetical protein
MKKSDINRYNIIYREIREKRAEIELEGVFVWSTLLFGRESESPLFPTKENAQRHY